jgi:hypothetical protein
VNDSPENEFPHPDLSNLWLLTSMVKEGMFPHPAKVVIGGDDALILG